MKKNATEGMVQQWIEEAKDSDIGLWWLADDVRSSCPDGTPDEQVQEQTLALLSPLLREGSLRAVTLLAGGKYEEWDGSADDIIERIRVGWERTVAEPDIGEIVWFVGPREI